MRRSSLSSVSRGMACVGSVAMPQILRAGVSEVGSAMHDCLDVRVSFGAAAAFDELPRLADKWRLDDEQSDELNKLARSFKPSIPEGAISEVPLVMLADGSVQLAVGARGVYDVPADAIIAGTLDLLWSEPEPLVVGSDGIVRCPIGSTLVVVDWKTGDAEWVAPARINAQVRGGALLAARWAGAASAAAGICFVRPGEGVWDVAPVMDGTELATVEVELREQAKREVDEMLRVASGLPPRLTTGPHCDWCPSSPLCPAHVAEARALATTEDPSPTLTAELTKEQAEHLAGVLSSVRRTADHVEAALRAYVLAHGNLTLSNGKSWGPVDTTRAAYDPRVVLTALADEIGEKAAMASCSVSANSIERAIKSAHEAAGVTRKVSSTKRRVLNVVREKNGIVEVQSQRWAAHWERSAAELPAPPELPEIGEG